MFCLNSYFVYLLLFPRNLTILEQSPVKSKKININFTQIKGNWFYFKLLGQPVRRYEKVAGSDPENVFSVAPITGKVSLNSRLDYESSPTKVSWKTLLRKFKKISNMKIVIN